MYKTRRSPFEKLVPRLFHPWRLDHVQCCAISKVLDSLNVSAGSICVMELAKVAASLLVKSNDRVIVKEANVEVVDCRNAADRLRSVR